MGRSHKKVTKKSLDKRKASHRLKTLDRQDKVIRHNIANDIGFSDSFADNPCTENLRKTIEKYDNHPSILNIKNVMRTKLDNVSAELNFTHVNHNDIYKIIKALDFHKILDS